MADISIISPSLNSASVIADCIRSVAEQGHVVEHLVIDGHSSDGTKEVIRDSGAKVRIIDAAPGGIYQAVNEGIDASRGEIVGILHTDDFYAAPNVLDRIAAAFEDDSVDACYGDLCYVEGSNPSHIVRY